MDGTLNISRHIEHSSKLNILKSYLTRKSTDNFFQESTITGIVYLDMFSRWLVFQLQEESDDFVWVQEEVHLIGSTM